MRTHGRQAGPVHSGRRETAGKLPGPVAETSAGGESGGTGLWQSAGDMDLQGRGKRLLPRRHPQAGTSQLEGKTPRPDAWADQGGIPADETEPVDRGGLEKVQAGPGQRRPGEAPG